uniref:Retrotransposon gag domain-containing protein n=1 Tax=Tanacetum cinerariifolium TaxID=118510 RepID=A0A6L2J3L6_TANCI|nr:hypothetical protein [Tanacetum cinerariifolium]
MTWLVLAQVPFFLSEDVVALCFNTADQLLHHELEGRVDGLVKEVKGLENQQEDVVDELVHEMVMEGDFRNVNVNNSRGGCSYKDCLACNPKDFDGKGGAIAYTRWTEKMESIQDMSGCGDHQKTRGQEPAIGMTWEDFKALMREEFYPNNEMQKLESEIWCHIMVRAGHAPYTDRFHKLARLVLHLVTPENKRIERVLTDEAIRNGSYRKNTEKRGNGESQVACLRLNRAPGQRENHLNQAMPIDGGQGRGNNGNLAHGRACMIGTKEAP